MHGRDKAAHIHVDEFVGAIARLVGAGTAALDRAAQVFADVEVTAPSELGRLFAGSVSQRRQPLE